MRLALAAALALLNVSVGVALSSAAIAAEALPPRPFAFSTMNKPSKVKCIQIDVSGMKCIRVNLEVGYAQQCSKVGKKQTYLVFKSKAACMAEREREMANED